jgi:Outer membrane protein beta-barrel domain
MRYSPFVLGALAIGLVLRAPMAAAQTVEASPVGGYRFGGDLFELVTNSNVDLDGAPVVGGALNVAMGDGLSFEALVTRQHADVTTRSDVSGASLHWRVVVDQYLAGGRQEFDFGRARPFLTGLLGLTRSGTDGDNELRFTVAAGGGVKVPLQRRLGLRLDGRVFTTFIDADSRAVACVDGTCLVGLDVDVAWQAEFTAAMVLVF